MYGSHIVISEGLNAQLSYFTLTARIFSAHIRSKRPLITNEFDISDLGTGREIITLDSL